MSKSKDIEAKKTVLSYLNKQNRPYSAVDIFNNLHKEYGKTAVVRSLEELVKDGQITEKVYGKQKVYAPDQSQYPDVDDAELKAMDAKIAEITKTLQAKQENCKRLEQELSALNSALTTEEAQDKLTTLTAQFEKYTNRLQTLKGNSNSVSPQDRKIIMSAREKYVKEWRKRRRMATEISDSVLEGYPKTKRQFYEEVGLEPDEDFGVKPPEL